MTPGEISESVLKHLESLPISQADFVENVRLALGLSLSSIHAVMIYGAKTEQQQEAAVYTALDTVDRMVACIKRDVESAGITCVEIEAMGDLSGPQH